MKIVLDTNVIISAFATHGICKKVFETSLLNFSIILSDFILDEIKDVLSSKLKIPQEIIDEIIGYLKENSTLVVPETISFSACKDQKDLNILGTAISGKAKFIITSDKDLLEIKDFEGIKIVNPREFYENFKKFFLKINS